MVSDEKRVKLGELVGNDDVAVKIIACKSPDELQKVLAESGLHMTMDELLEISKEINEKLKGNNKELSEDELDSVAGGGKVWDTFVGVLGMVGSAFVGQYWATAICALGIWATWYNG